MTWPVTLDERAINRVAGFLADDPEGVRKVFEAIDALAENPRPEDSFPFGSQDRRRVRVGRYRIVYAIEQDSLSVEHIARLP